MTSTWWGGGGGGDKNEILSDLGGWGVSECSGRPIFIFFYWICAKSRHHALTEPNIDILLTRNLTFRSDVRQ